MSVAHMEDRSTQLALTKGNCAVCSVKYMYSAQPLLLFVYIKSEKNVKVSA